MRCRQSRAVSWRSGRVGEVEEDGPCGVHDLRDAARALAGVQGEVGCEGAGQGVLRTPHR